MACHSSGIDCTNGKDKTSENKALDIITFMTKLFQDHVNH